jgi:beta-lactamase superfamily II metal-dependent hydrolase
MSLAVNNGLLQVIDVEHGACSLLTVPAPGGGVQRMLIDCGHNASTQFYPGDHLKKVGASRLEQLVVTNFDEDHASGFPNLEGLGIPIDWFLVNPTVTPQTIRTLKTEDGMGKGIDALANRLDRIAAAPRGLIAQATQMPNLPGVKTRWFYNKYPHFQDENNLSVVLHLEIHGTSFLFPGDMERAGFENLLNTVADFRTVVSGLHVLMASHHGRANGICPDLFDKWSCKPQIVVISDDYKQHYSQETVNYYASKCSGINNFREPGRERKVLTTRNDGEIKFSFTQGQCLVT